VGVLVTWGWVVGLRVAPGGRGVSVEPGVRVLPVGRGVRVLPVGRGVRVPPGGVRVCLVRTGKRVVPGGRGVCVKPGVRVVPRGTGVSVPGLGVVERCGWGVSVVMTAWHRGVRQQVSAGSGTSRQLAGTFRYFTHLDQREYTSSSNLEFVNTFILLLLLFFSYIIKTVQYNGS
jgi:hypothetical protein